MKEREIAYTVLLEITENRGYANVLLENRLHDEAHRTQGFVRRVVYGVLDRLDELDQLIDTAIRSSRKRLDPRVRTLLRLSLYQLRYMDRTAAHGVINDAVKLTRKYSPRYAGFVNAMLRTLQKSEAKPESGVSMPGFLLEKLQALYGASYTDELLQVLAKPSHLCIRMNPLKTTEKELAVHFSFADMAIVSSKLIDGVFRVQRPRGVFTMPAYREGHFTPQDEGAAIVIGHAGPEKGEDWLDLCAAPGGKTTQLAERLRDESRVVGCDLTARKVEKINAHALRLGLTSIQTEVQDARIFRREWEDAFSGVLVDAPCSGLGLIRRKPDIMLHRTEKDILDLLPLQKEILETAARYVKPGGKLIYSTCTLLQEENEMQVRTFLQNHSEFLPDGGDFEHRTDMVTDDCDGFYMARLRRRL